VKVGETFTRKFPLYDRGISDTYYAKVNYGDGTPEQSLTIWLKNSTLSHKYNAIGDYTITVNAWDTDGGSSSATCTVTVTAADSTPPTTTCDPATFVGTTGDNGWYTSDVTVPLTFSDGAGGTGVKITEYGFDGITWYTYSAPITISNEGMTTLYYRSTDNQGYVETPGTQTIKIDKTAPTIAGAPVAISPNGWYNADVTVHFTVNDPASGIAFVTPDVVLTAEGAGQTVPGTATDNAGNTANCRPAKLALHRLEPFIKVERVVHRT
jgi:hypothetical protein